MTAGRTVRQTKRRVDALAHGDITHIDIPVSDLEKGAEFYSGLFGWQISEMPRCRDAEMPGFEDYPMWQAPNRISGGGLAPRSEDFSQPRSHVEVDSIDDTIIAAVTAGASVVMGKTVISETSSWAIIRDSDGSAIGLYEGTTDTQA